MNGQKKTMYHLKKTNALEWFSRVIKCQYTCPVHTNVPAYVKLIREGDFEGAYKVNRVANLFPAILGRLCPHPCEDVCRRGKFDEPVSICALKRAAADYSEKETELPLGIEAITKKQGKRVAIVGSGPAGLACANDLALLGYDVVIYEALDRIGGMLNVGIPPYRLPRKLIQQEVSRVMSALGVEIKLNTPIGEKLTLGNLRKEYDAIFIAAGAHKSIKLGIEGEALQGVIPAVEFLRKINLGETPEIGRKVVVIGGGDVAMDCVRTVIRLGAESVHIKCLESREEMPAADFEVEEAIQEGAILRPSLGLKRILGKDGKVTGVETVVCKSVFDSQGRFNPTFVEGTESIIKADNIIVAIGQASDLSLLQKQEGFEVVRGRTIKVDPESLHTTVPGVFAGGDVATGPRLLIDAIAQGHKAAQSIHAYLTQSKIPQKRAHFKLVKGYTPPVGYDTLSREKLRAIPVDERRQDIWQARIYLFMKKLRAIPVNERRGLDAEVDLGLSKDAIQREAMRCFQCQLNIVIDSKKCVLCGGCVDVCPNKCIRMVSLDRIKGLDNVTNKGAALVMNEEECMRCGLCVQRCPTRAINMVEFSVEEV
ncbi:MAG: FAD-dependent oxidoreductase [Planctomycetes bacterium]|nr:FAD-dependent oxidoreductase [Planctomycetota bacterium]